MNEREPDPCVCASLSDLAAVPMGGAGLDERLFATVEPVRDHGGDLWWLYLSKCSACGQNWLVAQEETVFDEYFLRRLSETEAQAIFEDRWPDEFRTYQRVLEVGHGFGHMPCIFLDPLAWSLVWAAKDLRKERPDISVDEIARLLGVRPRHAARLLKVKGR